MKPLRVEGRMGFKIHVRQSAGLNLFSTGVRQRCDLLLIFFMFWPPVLKILCPYGTWLSPVPRAQSLAIPEAILNMRQQTVDTWAHSVWNITKIFQWHTLPRRFYYKYISVFPLSKPSCCVWEQNELAFHYSITTFWCYIHLTLCC